MSNFLLVNTTVSGKTHCKNAMRILNKLDENYTYFLLRIKVNNVDYNYKFIYVIAEQNQLSRDVRKEIANLITSIKESKNPFLVCPLLTEELFNHITMLTSLGMSINCLQHSNWEHAVRDDHYYEQRRLNPNIYTVGVCLNTSIKRTFKKVE